VSTDVPRNKADGEAAKCLERKDCPQKKVLIWGVMRNGSILSAEEKMGVILEPNPTRQTESDEPNFLESGFATNNG
jgi:hypothetical protein